MANSQHTPAPASTSLKWILYLLAFLGSYGTWIRSAINGALFIIFETLHVIHTLAGTKWPIKTSFTGIYWPIDYLLDVLIVFWWQAVDGSHPSTAISSLYFAGQHVGVIAALMSTDTNLVGGTVVSSKIVPARLWIAADVHSPTLWLLVFQFTAIATSGPCFALLAYPLMSPPPRLSGSDLDFVRVLPMSIITGYVLFLVAMALPCSGARTLVSPELQQIAVVAWNVFPIFVTLCQYVFQGLVRVFGCLANKD